MANPTVISTAQSASNFMSTLAGEQNSAFQENQAALQAINNAWTPVIQGGQIPYGYSPQLDSILKSNIITTNAQATANATNAAALQAKQASGGAGLPSGATEAQNALIQAKGQQAEAAGLQQEKEQGYQQGITNLQAATQGLEGVAEGSNEVGLAGASTDAGQLGLSAAEAQWKENQTSSPAAILGDVGEGLKDVTSFGNALAMFDPNLGIQPQKTS